MSPILFIEQLLNGLQFGVMLFVMAAGLTLVFGVMGLINLAHGSLYMLGAFACAAHLDITPQATPHLYTLMRRTLVDAGLSTYRAKDHYKRTRPFAAHQDGSCTPEEEPKLAKDGSYPSGHAALGWAWALVLSELMPDRTDALQQRGYAFGQSRVVCGVHWQSDVEAGRVVGAAAVARLHADPVFEAQMRAAEGEIRAARAAGRGTSADCAAEAAALKP